MQVQKPQILKSVDPKSTDIMGPPVLTFFMTVCLEEVLLTEVSQPYCIDGLL